jgi:hypothetical protein
MEEILPGVHHWTALRETIGSRVHSYYVTVARAVIDPMVPDEGLEAIAALGPPPERLLLTNRHHYRHADRYVEAFGCTVHCHEAGLHEFGDGQEVEGFAFGDEVAPGIVAHELGSITPEECALHVPAGPGALAFADGVVRRGDGFGFVPDGLLGDDPEDVKDGIRAALRHLLQQLRFDAVLLAHGEPMASGGRDALARLASSR